MMDLGMSRLRAAPVPQVREMSIQRALEWAFRDECARVEFDELGETSGGLRGGVDGIWLMMQRGQLGCKIDGGGWSEPASDAELIASAVTNLPIGYGGREMAIRIADLARAGLEPDWMRGERPKFLPRDVHQNPSGWRAATSEAHHLGCEGWPPVERKGRNGKVRVEPVLYCPVCVMPTPGQIARARRVYLDWWGALLWLRTELVSLNILSRVRITDAMPSMTPWREQGA
jgi:hypothetical protein